MYSKRVPTKPRFCEHMEHMSDQSETEHFDSWKEGPGSGVIQRVLVSALGVKWISIILQLLRFNVLKRLLSMHSYFLYVQFG